MKTHPVTDALHLVVTGPWSCECWLTSMSSKERKATTHVRNWACHTMISTPNGWLIRHIIGDNRFLRNQRGHLIGKLQIVFFFKQHRIIHQTIHLTTWFNDSLPKWRLPIIILTAVTFQSSKNSLPSAEHSKQFLCSNRPKFKVCLKWEFSFAVMKDHQKWTM